MRSALALALAACLLAAPARAAEAPADRACAAPPRALVIGDSNIFGPLGHALQAGLRAWGFQVTLRGKPTSGLARPDFFDWMEHAAELLDRHDPDVVIAMFGGNDGQRLEFADRRPRIKWEREDAWRAEYHARVVAMATLLAARGRRVFFLSPTNRRPALARSKMGRVREVQHLATAQVPGVTWIDMFPFSSDPTGHWLRWGRDDTGRRVRLRRSDGIHLTREGGQEVGRRLLPALLGEGLAMCHGAP